MKILDCSENFGRDIYRIVDMVGPSPRSGGTAHKIIGLAKVSINDQEFDVATRRARGIYVNRGEIYDVESNHYFVTVPFLDGETAFEVKEVMNKVDVYAVDYTLA